MKTQDCLLKLVIRLQTPPEMFLGKGVLKICSKCTGKHPCRRPISIKLFCNAKQLY